MKKGVKTVLTVFVSLVILLAVLIFGFCGYLYLKQEYAISKLPMGYYKDLAKNCRANLIEDITTDNFECCIDSIERMAEHNYKVSPETGCPDGFASNILRCPSSFKWCEPDTSNWKTYRNEEHGFEVKYSNDWLIEGNQDSVYFKRTDISQEEMEGRQIGYPLSILIENTSAKSVLAWFESEFSDRNKDLKPKKSTIKIGGLDGIRYSDPISIGGCNEDFVMIKDGKLFKFLRHGSTCDYSDELFSQILSTFKFIEPVDTSDWQIYHNKEYGFEVKYPDSFVAEQINNTIDFHPLEPNPSIIYPSISVFDGTLEERIQAIKIEFKISTSPFSKIISDREISLNNYTGKELILQSEMGHEIRYVFLIHNSKIYQFEVDNFDVGGLRNIFPQILSTFKFLE